MIRIVSVLGAKIHAITMSETVDIVCNAISMKKECQHVVVNVAKIVKMQEDKELRDAVNEADIINADGLPVVWASRILGRPLPERVAGIDLFDNLIRVCSQKSYKPFFFGATEEVVKKVVANYQQKYPNLEVAGYRNGYFKREDKVEKEIAKEIKESGADMLFIAFGTPHKEIFMSRWKDYMKVPFVMGVGGSFDVIAGITKRAPKWMQRFGLEWFYRILQEPGRMWKRYAKTNPVFVYLIAKELVLYKILRLKK